MTQRKNTRRARIDASVNRGKKLQGKQVMSDGRRDWLDGVAKSPLSVSIKISHNDKHVLTKNLLFQYGSKGRFKFMHGRMDEFVKQMQIIEHVTTSDNAATLRAIVKVEDYKDVVFHNESYNAPNGIGVRAFADGIFEVLKKCLYDWRVEWEFHEGSALSPRRIRIRK